MPFLMVHSSLTASIVLSSSGSMKALPLKSVMFLHSLMAELGTCMLQNTLFMYYRYNNIIMKLFNFHTFIGRYSQIAKGIYE